MELDSAVGELLKGDVLTLIFIVVVILLVSDDAFGGRPRFFFTGVSMGGGLEKLVERELEGRDDVFATGDVIGGNEVLENEGLCGTSANSWGDERFSCERFRCA